MPTPRRLLVPVKLGDDPSRIVAYAQRNREQGFTPSVCLLHVEDAAALQLSAGRDGVRHRGDEVFAAAMRMLERRGIEFAAYIRSGPIVFSILDAAEELDCDEIVVSEPGTGLLRLLSRDIVATLSARKRSIPVVRIDKRGDAAS